MSDFFYKERLGPVFSPVINIKKQEVPSTVLSAIDNLLSPSGNMFTRAETVRNLMKIEGYGIEQTAKALSMKMSDVAVKLRLLEFSAAERQAILEYNFSERGAVLFLSLDKPKRLFAIEYCHANGYNEEQIQGYVEGFSEAKREKRTERAENKGNIRKTIINDVGFVLNSIENTLKLAKKAGLEIFDEKSENEECCSIHITLKKRRKK